MRGRDNACVYLKILQCSYKNAAREVESIPIDRLIFIAYEDRKIDQVNCPVGSPLAARVFFFHTTVFVVV